MSQEDDPGVRQLALLEERARRLALDKSYLQLIIRLMNKVGAASGLDDVVGTLLANILDVIGGSNIALYYPVDGQMRYADLYGKRELGQIEDARVREAFETRRSIEEESDFSETRMTTREFGKAWTWAVPLVAGNEVVAVLKLENLHIAAHDLYGQLPVFFSYVASVIKNEILDHTRLKGAYDELRRANAALEAARAELELRVEERTKELRTANELLAHNLREKEVLLQEVHHRVKNNLSVVAGLLELQASEITTPEEAVKAFRYSQDRIAAMALIQQQLHQSKDYANVDMEDYLGQLIMDLTTLYGVDPSVNLVTRIDRIFLDVALAVPCGLIVNELVTNAFKYAFPSGGPGTIEVSLSEVGEGTVEFQVRDDGVGMPPPETRRKGSLGLTLIDLLASQVDGKVSLREEGGTCFSVRIPRRKKS